MYIFEKLCEETDDETRKADIMLAVLDHCKKKVSDILFDPSAQSSIELKPQTGVKRITYCNGLGKIILTPNGINRIDSFGTAWGVTGGELSDAS